MIGNAQRDGAIHPDVTFGDVSLLLIRLARCHIVVVRQRRPLVLL